MSGLPNKSNFFSTLNTKLSRKRVAKLYGALDWEVRKIAWYDYEVRCPWAELEIEGEAPMLLHGAVADVLTNAEALLAPLRAANISFSAECYGPDGELLREWKSQVHLMTAPRRRWFRPWLWSLSCLGISAVAAFLTPAIARKQSTPIPHWERAIAATSIGFLILAGAFLVIAIAAKAASDRKVPS